MALVKKEQTSIFQKLNTWLRVDVEYIATGNFWLSIFHAVAIASVLILTILYGRILPRQVYGEYGFVIAVAEILSVFTLGGFFTVIIQEVAKGNEGIFSLAIKKTLKWSLLIPLAAFLIAGYYFFEGNTTYGYIFILIGITLPIYKISSFSDALLLGRKAFKISSFYNIAANASLTALLIITVLLHANLLVLASMYLIGRTLIEYVIYISTLERYPLTNAKVEKGSEAYAVHLSMLRVVAMCADQIDSVLLFFFAGPANLALYSFAIGGPELIKGFSKNVSMMSLPHFSGKSLEEMRKGLMRKVLYVAVMMAVVIAAYIVVAPYAFEILLPKYVDAVRYSQIFSLSVIIVAANTLLISVLQSTRSKESIYKFIVVSEVLQILFLFIGIKYYGVLGAIIAYICIRAFRFCYAVYLIWGPQKALVSPENH